MTRCLIFDYDGLICDTECAIYRGWGEFYRAHGQELQLHDWLKAVGHVDNFDPRRQIEELTGRSFDWTASDAGITARVVELVAELPALPGVRELMLSARDAGIAIGVASNSGSGWVRGGLARLGLAGVVDAVRTREDVTQHKPHPDVYLAVLEAVGADAAGSVAFEDSGPGVLAAKAAGLRTVAVPNGLTRHHDLSPADVVLGSVAEFDFAGWAGLPT